MLNILTLPPVFSTNSQTTFQWRYQPVKTTLPHPDGGVYESFGLALYQCSRTSRLHLNTIEDISTCLRFVEHLALTFTLHQLSPVHFRDAVLDSIS